MKGFLRLATALFFAACLVQTAAAATIDYVNIEYLDDNRWRYDYKITNDLDFNVEAFSIQFDYGFYSNLDVVVSWVPSGWEYDFSDPEFVYGTEYPGELLAWTECGGIAPGDTLLGFSVSFDWLGEGTPGGYQWFEIIDLANPEGLPLWSGYTTAPEIPEPQTLLLLGTGLLGLVAYYRRNKSRNAGNGR